MGAGDADPPPAATLRATGAPPPGANICSFHYVEQFRIVERKEILASTL